MYSGATRLSFEVRDVDSVSVKVDCSSSAPVMVCVLGLLENSASVASQTFRQSTQHIRDASSYNVAETQVVGIYRRCACFVTHSKIHR